LGGGDELESSINKLKEKKEQVEKKEMTGLKGELKEEMLHREE